MASAPPATAAPFPFSGAACCCCCPLLLQPSRASPVAAGSASDISPKATSSEEKHSLLGRGTEVAAVDEEEARSERSAPAASTKPASASERADLGPPLAARAAASAAPAVAAEEAAVAVEAEAASAVPDSVEDDSASKGARHQATAARAASLR